MAPPPFATTVDLQDYLVGLGRPVPTEAQLVLGQMLLDALTQGLREDTGQIISRATSTVTLYPTTDTADLPLPQQPVISVAAVTIDGATSSDWSLRHGSLRHTRYWACDSAVTVTFTYGYAPVPADVALHVVMCAAEGLDGGREIDNERLGDYAVHYAASPPGEHLALGRAVLIARYRIHTAHQVPVGPGHSHG